MSGSPTLPEIQDPQRNNNVGLRFLVFTASMFTVHNGRRDAREVLAGFEG
jgi:hypothetical protein